MAEQCVLQFSDAQALRDIERVLANKAMGPLETSGHLCIAKALYESLHPETRHGGDRRSGRRPFSNAAPRFIDYIAQRTGFSERTASRLISLHERLSPEARKALPGSWVAKRQHHLEAIGRLPRAKQAAIVDVLKASPPIPARQALHVLAMGRARRR